MRSNSLSRISTHAFRSSLVKFSSTENVAEKFFIPQNPLTGRSETKSLTQFPLFEDEVGPGVANTKHDLSITEAAILILIKQGDQVWLPYPTDDHAKNGGLEEV